MGMETPKATAPTDSGMRNASVSTLRTHVRLRFGKIDFEDAECSEDLQMAEPAPSLLKGLLRRLYMYLAWRSAREKMRQGK